MMWQRLHREADIPVRPDGGIAAGEVRRESLK